MSRAYRVPMTVADVTALAAPILHREMAPYGVGPVEVKEERDFDGTNAWRIVVSVQEKVPVKILIDASDEIQQTLREEGDDRWAYVGTKRPEEPEVDGDVD